MPKQDVTMELNTKELDEYLETIVRRGQNLRPFFVSVISILHNSVIENFRVGGRPKKWKPLSGWTLAGRAAAGTLAGHGLGQPILQGRTGQLRRDVGNVKKIGRRHVEFGISNPIAPTHQFGATITPKRAQWLTLPFPGVTGKARDYKDTFFRKSKKGNLILFQTTADGIRPLFLLRKKVKIAARPFIMFQKRDIEQITGLAAAFAYDDKGYERLAKRMTRRKAA